MDEARAHPKADRIRLISSNSRRARACCVLDMFGGSSAPPPLLPRISSSVCLVPLSVSELVEVERSVDTTRCNEDKGCLHIGLVERKRAWAECLDNKRTVPLDLHTSLSKSIIRYRYDTCDGEYVREQAFLSKPLHAHDESNKRLKALEVCAVHW